MNLATAPEKPTTMSRLYDNQLNNTNLMTSLLGTTQKAKSSNPGVGNYTSISSNGGENNSNYESS